jgi:LuxR family transcriptional activator of bioluminescence operon
MNPKMRRLDEFHIALQRFSTAISMEEIKALCQVHCRQLGFDSFVFALRVPTQFADARLVMIDAYPPQWVSHYFEQAFYAVDPVMSYCAKHLVPLQWHELVLPDGSSGAHMMNVASDFGLRTGITMPVHSPHGELGVLSFALNASQKFSREVTQQGLPYVQMLGGYLHEAVRRVSGLIENEGAPMLTKRELECLRWAADGKTSWEIAHLLHMSESTVNFHLKNSALKLDVCSRQHAVVKAVLQGLIKPFPF